MPDRLPGCDSLALVGSKLKNGQNLVDAATKAFGAPPAFWGRYFSSPGKSSYDPPKESPILYERGIKLLPIARQTNNVIKTGAVATQDAQNNIAALVEAFGKDFLESLEEPLYIFLDVETVLSADYYLAWANAIAAADIPLAPCAYMPSPPMHQSAWKALADAMKRGARCEGVWIAWYLSNSPDFVPLPPWDEKKTTQPTTAPTLAWQYMGNVVEKMLDLSVTNPNVAIDDAFLDHLIVPPC